MATNFSDIENDNDDPEISDFDDDEDPDAIEVPGGGRNLQTALSYAKSKRHNNNNYSNNNSNTTSNNNSSTNGINSNSNALNASSGALTSSASLKTIVQSNFVNNKTPAVQKPFNNNNNNSKNSNSNTNSNSNNNNNSIIIKGSNSRSETLQKIEIKSNAGSARVAPFVAANTAKMIVQQFVARNPQYLQNGIPTNIMNQLLRGIDPTMPTSTNTTAAAAAAASAVSSRGVHAAAPALTRMPLPLFQYKPTQQQQQQMQKMLQKQQQQHPQPLMTHEDDEAEFEELGVAETYNEYWPVKLKFGRKHPDPVVETASLSSVVPCDVYYKLSLPQETIDNGSLSALQLESVTYAGQAHDHFLPDGNRAGFLIGDGAGVGKGRTIAGIIYDNYLKGRKRALWISVSSDLKYDAERDLSDIGATRMKVHMLNKFKYEKITSDANNNCKRGIVFSTYSALIGESNNKTGKYTTRFNQILHWCGENFDGVIVFDECHKAKNLCPTGAGKPTKTGRTVLQLQEKLPKARIVYASATGATEPRNMAYMVRLGLWGSGTTFKDFNEFIMAVEKRGVGAMEIVAMDMKLRGMYIARQLSFKGVTFKIEEVPMSEKFRRIYDTSVQLWVEAMQKFTEAAVLIDAETRMRKTMWAQFWSSHQRFFKYLCIASKVEHVIRIATQSIKNGKCVVIGLQSTGEARTLEALDRDDGELHDFVSTAKGVFQSFVERHFPAPDRDRIRRILNIFDRGEQRSKTPEPAWYNSNNSNSNSESNNKFKGNLKRKMLTTSSQASILKKANREGNYLRSSDDDDNDDNDVVNNIKNSRDNERNDSDESDTDLESVSSNLDSSGSERSFYYNSDDDDEPWLKRKEQRRKSKLKKKKQARLAAIQKKEISAAINAALVSTKSQKRTAQQNGSAATGKSAGGGGGGGGGGNGKTQQQIENLMQKKQDLKGTYTPVGVHGAQLNYGPPPKSAIERACSMKEELLRKIEQLGTKLPPNTLDQLIDELGGPDNVAEMTGRRGRVIQSLNGNISYESRSGNDVPLETLNLTEKQRFMNGEKDVAIISEAASSGVSLQSDRRVRNQRRRVHITLELPWSADRAIQQFGRTHRSNQVNAPEYIFLISDLAGERRFASTVAKRLESLGALTHGDRRATDTRDLSQFNIDNKYGREALEHVMRAIMGSVRPMVQPPADYKGNFFKDIADALVGVGLIVNSESCPGTLSLDKDFNNISKFLNRILGCPVELQNRLFQYFTDTMVEIINLAKRTSRFDMGILDLGAAGENVTRVKLLRYMRKHSTGTAPTELHTVRVERGMIWQEAMEKYNDLYNDHDGFYVTSTSRNGKRNVILAVEVEQPTARFDDTNVANKRKREPMFQIYRPNTGAQVRQESLIELKKKYRKVEINVAEKHWCTVYDASALICSHRYWYGSCRLTAQGGDCDVGCRQRLYHVLAGSVLSVWSRVESILTNRDMSMRMQVIRMKTTTGEKIVGILIPKSCYTHVITDLQRDSESEDVFEF